MKLNIRLAPAIAFATLMVASCADAKEEEASPAPGAGTERAADAGSGTVATQDDDLPLFYNISTPPNEIALVHLDSMEEDGDDITTAITTATRAPVRIGMGAVWKVHCGRGTMTLIQSVPFAPGFHGELITVANPEPVSERSTPENRTLYAMACGGAADLDPERVYFYDPTSKDQHRDILEAFWAGR